MIHVLIIDDDDSILEFLRVILGSQGYRISEAHSGEEGWKMIQKETPDLVILDCIMEEFTTGFTLAHDLDYYHPQVPVVMLSSVGEHMSADWSFGPADRGWLPVWKFLTKPVSAKTLIDTIEDLLSGRDGSQAAQDPRN